MLTSQQVQTLEKFMHNFYGYGTYTAPYWFIGKEEGGGRCIEEFLARLDTWDSDKRGQCELGDIRDYHIELLNRLEADIITYPGAEQSLQQEIKHIQSLFLKKPVNLQRTWSGLIRVLLNVKGYRNSAIDANDYEKIRNYQQHKLGRLDGETCLLELLPLPSPNSASFIYEQIEHSHFKNRAEYAELLLTNRISHLRRRIERHKPQVVVMYSSDQQYQTYWEQIADGASFTKHKIAKGLVRVGHSRNQATKLIIIEHPANSVENDYFNQVGSTYISDWLKEEATSNLSTAGKKVIDNSGIL